MSRFYVSGMLTFLAVAAFAQAPDSTNGDVNELRSEIRKLKEEVQSLRADTLGVSSQEDELDAVEERLDKRLQELENKIDAVSRSTAPIALNPKMTAFINFAARHDDKTVYDATGNTVISNKPFLRTVEMELGSAVDPYAEAVTIISLEDEAGQGYSIDAEEAYALIKRLPIIESAPLGLKLKLGRYRAPLGVDNVTHLHDLPWTTRPLVVSKFFGTEHGEFFESGFNPVGLDAQIFLPSPVPGATFEANADVVRGGDIALSQGQLTHQPAYVGRLTLSEDWNNEHLLVLGASAYTETGSQNTHLFGGDLTYKWAPTERRESHSFVAGAEAYVADRFISDSLRAFVKENPVGWFGYLQYQCSYWTYLGVRYDWVEEPTNDAQVTKAISAYVSYYTTEFLRFRLGFEHKSSDALVASLNNTNSIIFEANVVFGSHPVEPYWVNR
ncbi:MAG TPA: hypothetical protein VMG34_03470 [Bacteroidota bacterium]|nr:hypothetical protein [Bacteroidota bacterium]